MERNWDIAKIFVDWIVFFLVTTDLYGNEILEHLAARLGGTKDFFVLGNLAAQ